MFMYVSAGALLVMVGKHEEALATYDQLLHALQEGQQQQQAGRRLGSPSMDLAARKAAALHEAEVTKLKGDAYVAAGDIPQAEQAFGRAAELYTLHGEGPGKHSQVAELRQRLGEVRMARQARRLAQEAAVLGASQPELALEVYKQALQVLEGGEGGGGGGAGDKAPHQSGQWVALERADLLKTMGDMWVIAMRDVSRAADAYLAASELYALHLGPRHKLTLQTEALIHQLPQQLVVAEANMLQHYDEQTGKFWGGEVDPSSAALHGQELEMLRQKSERRRAEQAGEPGDAADRRMRTMLSRPSSIKRSASIASGASSGPKLE